MRHTVLPPIRSEADWLDIEYRAKKCIETHSTEDIRFFAQLALEFKSASIDHKNMYDMHTELQNKLNALVLADRQQRGIE